jgi:hypothetical protein
MQASAIAGERFTSTDQPSPRSRAGRTCAEAGCATRLSIYNDSRYCSLHHRMAVPRTRGRKIA